jgi:hypothetical protein
VHFKELLSIISSFSGKRFISEGLNQNENDYYLTSVIVDRKIEG